MYTTDSLSDLVYVLLLSSPLAVALLHILAIFLLTAREHRYEHQLAGNRVRVLLRISSMGSLIIAGSLVFTFGRGSTNLTLTWSYIDLGLCLLLIPTYVLTFVHLRTLATRIHHASLAEHCLIVAAGISLSILMPILLQAGVAFAGEIKSVVPPLVVITTIFLFLIWSTYLLIRFALVFARTANIARKNWHASDASQTE